MEYGYVRVSTMTQNEQRQIVALNNFGIDNSNIYVDRISGSTMDRPYWNELLVKCCVGDTIVIQDLDRLGRNLTDIKDTYELLHKKGIFIKVLNDGLLSTQGKSEIERELIQPLLLHILGYVAERERSKTLERQREALDLLPKDDKGRMIGKTNNFIGRPNKQENLSDIQVDIIKRWINGEMMCYECVDRTGLSKSTLYRIKRTI